MRTGSGFARVAVSLLGALVPILTGCAGPPAASGADASALAHAAGARVGASRSPSQVTEEQYRAAFTAYADCMREKGFPLRITTDAGPLVRYGVPEGATDSGADASCYAAFLPVDRGWHAVNERPEDRAARIRACLEAHGVKAPLSIRRAEALVDEHHLTDVCTFA
ncbi:hypothetical protein [Streptomyces sp. NPDC048577]|uniref:hypothetical protein n=1 Tax=Streptomyces sp. NPDC048577 TaxID=3157209 RepID=UPI0034285554